MAGQNDLDEYSLRTSRVGGSVLKSVGILIFLIGLLATAPLASAQYTVDGVVLGDRIPTTGPTYSAYTCKPSEDFADLTHCLRTTRRAQLVVSNTLLHARDGSVRLLRSHATSERLSRDIVQAEVDELSRQMKGRPKIARWSNGIGTAPTSFIAVWGEIELEQLNPGSDDYDPIGEGKDPKIGVLLDTAGDLKLSAKSYSDIYRLVGRSGYVYTANFRPNGRGLRQYVAINAGELASGQFVLQLQTVLRSDRTLAADDYRLWPDVARLTRRLSRDTSIETANLALDNVFEQFPSKKLHSHAWSILPGGVIEHLAKRFYGTIDVYGIDTKYPEIRKNIIDFLVKEPSAPFVELLHYTIGEFDKALEVSPKSVIRDVLHYATGHKQLERLLGDIFEIVGNNEDKAHMKDSGRRLGVDMTIRFLNQNPDRYGSKPLEAVIPRFRERVAAMTLHFETVQQDASSPHADDAAYMLGWLAFHQGHRDEALRYLARAMNVGNNDYLRPAALKQAIRVLELYPAEEQSAIVDANDVLAKQPALWYVASRSAFRQHKYDVAIASAEKALRRLNVPLDRIPASTDAGRIEAALRRISSRLGDVNVSELPYLIQASREILQYRDYLKSAAQTRPSDLMGKAKAMIFKYSMLLDEPQPAPRRDPAKIAHKDLRQALYLIDVTMASVPKDPSYARVREWLYYRKARVLAAYEPGKVSSVVAEMEKELPASRLLDDALAEQIYAEGIILQDLNAAERTFKHLKDNYGTGNAVDNAHSWMAIAFRCARRVDEAKRINDDIIRLFPRTRHARYALERNARPDGCGL